MTSPPPEGSVTADRVLPATRWLAAFLLPFLAVAFVLLFVWPGRTDQLFAWTIRPDLTAMMLSAAYLGGILFFWRTYRETRWHHVKNGFPAILTFATLLGVATALHWERFHPGHVSFIAWAGLYFTTPVLVLWAWLANRRVASEGPETGDIRLPGVWRWLFFLIGTATLGVAVALWVTPTVMRPLWPWTLTPLTTLVVGALFTLPGMVGLMIACDGRWSAARTLVQAQLLAIGVILLAAFRDRTALDYSHAAAWGFVGGMSVMFVLLLVLLLRMDGWQRAPGQAMGGLPDRPAVRGKG